MSRVERLLYELAGRPATEALTPQEWCELAAGAADQAGIAGKAWQRLCEVLEVCEACQTATCRCEGCGAWCHEDCSAECKESAGPQCDDMPV